MSLAVSDRRAIRTDVIYTMIARQTEEVQRFGGMEALDEPYTEISFWRMVQKRAGWLCALFFSEMLTASAMQGYENELANARNTAIAEMEQRAVELGAHGIIGVDFAYETLGGTGMLMVAVSGTAVRFAN